MNAAAHSELNLEEPSILRATWVKGIPTSHDEMLYIGDVPLVHRTEQGIQEQMVEQSVSVGDRVLEIGYGWGFASLAIERKSPVLHTIIEANNVLAQTARNKMRNAQVICGFWEDVVGSKLDFYDSVIFDACSSLSFEQGLAVDLAIRHLVPAWHILMPRLKSGTKIGVIVPTGNLTEAEIVALMPSKVKTFKLTDSINCPQPTVNGWFSDGCKLLTLIAP